MREKERLVRNLRKKLKHWYEVDRERLLDYIEGKLLDVFDEHIAPVYGIQNKVRAFRSKADLAAISPCALSVLSARSPFLPFSTTRVPTLNSGAMALPAELG